MTASRPPPSDDHHDRLHKRSDRPNTGLCPWASCASTSGPASLITHAYDRLGRENVTAEYSAVGATNSFIRQTNTTYDGLSTTVTSPQVAGKSTKKTVDARGNLVQVVEAIDGTNATTAYEYDALNLLTKITDAAGNITTYAYDMLGRRTSSSDPDQGARTYTYSSAGDLTGFTDAMNQSVTYAYDLLHRQTTTIAGGITLASNVYDVGLNPDGSTRKGLLAWSSSYNPQDSSDYTTVITGYDKRNRPLGKTYLIAAGSNGQSAAGGMFPYSYTYDPGDHQTTVTQPAIGATWLSGPNRFNGTVWNGCTWFTASADLTGDAKADFLCADGAGNINVYPGDGAGNIGTSGTTLLTALGAGIRVAAPGDWNGDGKNDLIVAVGSQIRLYNGNGNGTVNTAFTSFGTLANASDQIYAGGNLNSTDNKPDLIVRDVGGLLWQRLNTTTISTAPTIGAPTQIGSGWAGLRLATNVDVDRDGYPDIVAADDVGNVRLYRFDSKVGAFYSAIPTIGSGWNFYNTLGAGGADFDGDGRNDVLARTTTGVVYMYRVQGTPAGTMPPDRVVDPSATLAGWSLAGGSDITNDTNPDLVYRNNTSGAVNVCTGTGTGAIGTCSAVPGLTLAAATNPWVVTPGNINGSTNPQNDVVALTSSGTIVLYQGTGTGTGTGISSTATATMASGVATCGNELYAPGDWDGDGYADLIIRNTANGDLWLLRGQNSNTLVMPNCTVPGQRIGSGWNNAPLIAPGDWDGDAKPDLILQVGSNWRLYRGSGTSFYYPYPKIPGSIPAFTSIRGAGDFNKDGKPDIAFIYSATNRFGYLANPGTPTTNQATEETITYTYTGRTGQPFLAQSDSTLDYAPSSTYDNLGRLTSRTQGYVGAMRRTYAYGTGGFEFNRLTQNKTEINGTWNYANSTYTPGTLAQDDRYAYDASGNIKAIADNVAQQNECFTYDTVDRLDVAYTDAYGAGAPLNCAAFDNTGPSPYIIDHNYNAIGNMTYNWGWSYCYPNPGQPRPHAVTIKQNTACGTTPTASDTFAYNGNGQMTTRTVSGTTTTLQWDPLGRLGWSHPGVSANNYINPPAAATRYVYDANGQRLARINADGNRTVYLENLEVRSTPSANQGGSTGSTTVRTWGFEGGTAEGFATWYNASPVENPSTGAQPRTGTRSLKVTAGDQFWGIADGTTTTVAGNTSYTFTAYAKLGDAGPATGVTALIRWYDGNSVGLGETVVGVQSAVTSAWTLISGNTVTSPANAAKAQIEFTSDTSSNGRVYYFDDLSLLTQTGGSSGGGTGGTTIKDWQFESAAGSDGLAAWYGIDTSTPGATEVTTAQAHAGTKSWKLTATGANWAIQDTPWPGRAITAGTTYTFSAWARAGSSTGTAQVQIKVAWIDANGAQIGTDMPIGTAVSDNASTWTELTGSATAPTTPNPAVRALIRISSNNSANGQVHYLDDVAISTGGSPAPPTTIPVVSYTRYYTIGGATIAMRRGDPAGQALTWLAGNLLGSVSVANIAESSFVSTQRYLPFGGLRGALDQISSTDRGFLGQIEDVGGLVYLNARYYDPTLAKFVSTDPLASIQDPQTLNAYAYGLNNPTNLSDATGLCASVPGEAAACFGGGSDSPSQAGVPIGGCSGQPAYCVFDDYNDAARQFDAGHSASERYNSATVSTWFGEGEGAWNTCISGIQRWKGCAAARTSIGWFANGEIVGWIGDPFSAGFAGYAGSEEAQERNGWRLTNVLIAAAPLLARLYAPSILGGARPGWADDFTDRLPEGWKSGLNKKWKQGKFGIRWRSPVGQDGVRIDMGVPNSSWQSQRVDHVVVNSGGRIIGRDGNPLATASSADAHIPLSEWLTWKNWNSPW